MALSWSESEKTSGLYCCQKLLYQSKKKAGITRGRGLHSLRHSFATHLLAQGTDLYTIKNLLGHRSLKTTIVYLHLIQQKPTEFKSPLDTMYDEEGSHEE